MSLPLERRDLRNVLAKRRIFDRSAAGQTIFRSWSEQGAAIGASSPADFKLTHHRMSSSSNSTPNSEPILQITTHWLPGLASSTWSKNRWGTSTTFSNLRLAPEFDA